MSLKKKALAGVFWSALEQFGNQIIGFVISIVLARLLLPEEFGLIAMLAIFMGLGGALINSGLTQSLIRTENPNDEDFSTVFYFNLLGSVVIYGLVSLLAPFIADFYNQPQLTLIVRVYCIVFIINAFAAVQTTRLSKKMDFRTQMLVSTPSLVISGFVGIGLALYGFGVWSLVWSRIAQAIASTVQLWYWSKWRPLWLFSSEKFTEHFNFGFKLTLSGILDTVFVNAYTIIIGKFFAPAQVGFYSKADGLQMLPVRVISGIVSKITYPLFSEIQNDDIRLKSVYKRIMQMVIFLVAPTLIFIAVLGEPIFRFLYTEKWLPAVPYFQILCAAGILYPIHAYNLQILNVKGRSDLFLKLEVAKKIVLLIVLAVSFQFGIYGLLFGSVIFSMMAFGINTHYTGKFINYTAWHQTKDLLPTILLALFSGLIVYGLDSMLDGLKFHDFVRISICGLVGGGVYLLFSILLQLESLVELKTLIKRKS
ncbi:lipopolysaccharide biosynthesis protein [Rhodonellum sp.]|uniref:lipopolysaccharide biosynthesis protein n=1 Tax=Rhodonellum sp. TaxID=2231180 RepID=UPI0027252FD2|nr:lipopolysaccharide biosynthesis protein [Rhodonellum sp.]MDO9551121.1 lipopolysaccharide biosynthesis protein [Rhodonellum sp.]